MSPAALFRIVPVAATLALASLALAKLPGTVNSRPLPANARSEVSAVVTDLAWLTSRRDLTETRTRPPFNQSRRPIEVPAPETPMTTIVGNVERPGVAPPPVLRGVFLLGNERSVLLDNQLAEAPRWARIGEKVAGAIIARIEADGAEIIRNGQPVWLPLTPADGAAGTQGEQAQ